MVMEKAVIVAGIGSSRGVGVDEVRAALNTALAAHKLDLSAVSALATTEFKKDEEGIFETGRQLGLRVAVVAPQPDEHGTLTHSPLSVSHAGTPSVSETAALAAAGPGAKLLGPRIATGRVTCALAESRP